MSMDIDTAIKIARAQAEEKRFDASCYEHLECERVKAKHDDLINSADNYDQFADWLEELKRLREERGGAK